MSHDSSSRYLAMFCNQTRISTSNNNDLLVDGVEAVLHLVPAAPLYVPLLPVLSVGEGADLLHARLGPGLDGLRVGHIEHIELHEHRHWWGGPHLAYNIIIL